MKSGSGFEENVSKKEVALRKALDQISSSFGKGSIMWLGQSVCSNHVPVVSTGSFALDIALGTGGLPKVICKFVLEILNSFTESLTVICLGILELSHNRLEINENIFSMFISFDNVSRI